MKILQLSTYPTILPRHGGQIRVSQIAHFLRLQGHQVRSFSLCEPTHKKYTPDDVLLGRGDLFTSTYDPIVYDYATSLLCVQEPYFSHLKQRIFDFAPDVVMVEQVWLYPLYKALYASLSPKPYLIYSSQNIEYKAKKEVFDSLQKHDDSLIQSIKELEQEVCAVADCVIACTQQDQEELKALGAHSVIVCPNGVERISKKKPVDEILAKLLCSRAYAIFVGSAHAPNAIGFWEMLSSSFAYLKPNQIIIVVGSVSYILKQYAPKDSPLMQLVNDEKIKLLGEVSDEVLGTLLEGASVILLPITMGGGSNLKTAEAIVANRPTVATTTAVRGFEFAHQLSRFIIADQQKDFIQAIQQAFLLKPSVLSKEEQKMRSRLYWGLTLSPLKELLDSLKQEKNDQTELLEENQ